MAIHVSRRSGYTSSDFEAAYNAAFGDFSLVAYTILRGRGVPPSDLEDKVQDCSVAFFYYVEKKWQSAGKPSPREYLSAQKPLLLHLACCSAVNYYRRHNRNRAISLDATLNGDSESTFADFLAANNAVDDAVVNSEWIVAFWNFAKQQKEMKRNDYHDLRVIIEKIAAGVTQSEIMEHLNITRDRLRNLRAKSERIARRFDEQTCIATG